MQNRINRINEELQKVIAEVIRNLKDPRINHSLVSVVNVAAASDLSQAKVYISVLADDEEQNKVIAQLKSAEGFIRHEASEKIDLRVMPKLLFTLDHSIQEGAHINEILKQIERKDSLKGSE
ncbi:MAG: 30S ribosome-binding factor RbfA [Clostridiales bacterium]|nr:30S ribosome-binding factor RbfA [Clostridiales bacterium]